MNKWTYFWFQIIDTRILSLLRIALGLVFLMKQIGLIDILSFEPINFEFPRHQFKSVDFFRLTSYRSTYFFSEYFFVPNFEQYNQLESVIFILTILWILGVFTRFVGLIMTFLFTYLFFLCEFNYHHHTWHFVLMLTVLSFSKCGQYYSIDNLTNKHLNRRKSTSFIYPIRMIQILVSCIYFFTASSKIAANWINGRALSIFLEPMSKEGIFASLLQNYSNYSLMSIAAIFSMYFIGISLWFTKTRNIAVLLGIIIHGMIDFSLSVETFSYQMWVSYLAFYLPRK